MSGLPVPRPVYSQTRESIVRAIPPFVICLFGCGGRDCRYEGPAVWTKNQQVIRGLFSNWVTDDIIAMSRPSSRLIEEYDIIPQFKQLNIKSIINMQFPGEHAHCGTPLDPGSGFSYSPETFMEHGIYFYNFSMPDFKVSSLTTVVDAVKVLAFSVQEGRVAVHCHAGLGRTGVLIACYLVYTLRISPSEAVHYVRIKRPRSIQTRTQINMVFDFARLMGTQLTQYPDLRLRHGAHFTLQHYLNRQALLLHGEEARNLRHTPKIVYLLCLLLPCLALGLPAPPEVNMELDRRTAVRALGQAVRETLLAKRYVPLLRRSSWLGVGPTTYWDEPQGFLERKKKVLLNKRSYSDSDIMKLGAEEDSKPDEDETQPVVEHAGPGTATANSERPNKKPRPKIFRKKIANIPQYNSNMELGSKTGVQQKSGSGQAIVARAVAKVMADQQIPSEKVLQRVALLQEELNSSETAWALLVTESDPHVLGALLWAWLEKLKDPVLNAEHIEKLTAGLPTGNRLSVLPKPQQHTVSCLLLCVGRVTSLCPLREDGVLRRLIRALTRRPQEELENHAVLMRAFRSSVREAIHEFTFTSRIKNK